MILPHTCIHQVARIGVAALAAALLVLNSAGCSDQRTNSPYTTPSSASRNTAKAEQLTREAASLIESDPERAEQLLREALAADIEFGPGHSNLGVIHLNRGDYYEAANEFEWARKLMPGHPDPRMNLALTLERAGRVDEALATYRTALEVYPGHIPTIQALTRLQIRHDLKDAGTHRHLESIALSGQTRGWREWARMQLLQQDAGSGSD